MGRKRKIPRESKRLKYFYIIIVKFKGKDILKFGISNNVIRRFTEYKNSDTIGYLKEVLDIYKCDYPKRIETMIKWKMALYAKPVFKYEYFDISEYTRIKRLAYTFSKQFGYKFNKIDIKDIKI